MLLLILDKLNDLVWTGIFLPCVLLCGLLLSLRSRFLQLRLFPASLRQLTKGGRGDGVSPVQAASTALASTLGTGNIVGTAQAIAMGGPGAVFWMWAAALLGMAVKFAEIGLSVATRRRDGAGYSGGPMYYIGSLGEKFRPLALMYALLAALSAFGIGNLSQISSAAGAVAGAAEKIAPELDPRRLRLWLGVILTLTAWLILRGGAAGRQRVAQIYLHLCALGADGDLLHLVRRRDPSFGEQPPQGQLRQQRRGAYHPEGGLLVDINGGGVLCRYGGFGAVRQAQAGKGRLRAKAVGDLQRGCTAFFHKVSLYYKCNAVCQTDSINIPVLCQKVKSYLAVKTQRRTARRLSGIAIKTSDLQFALSGIALRTPPGRSAGHPHPRYRRCSAAASG